MANERGNHLGMPYGWPGQSLKSDDITIITQTERGGSANKKQRIIEMKSNDQITVSITRSEEIPLDSDHILSTKYQYFISSLICQVSDIKEHRFKVSSISYEV